MSLVPVPRRNVQPQKTANMFVGRLLHAAIDHSGGPTASSRRFRTISTIHERFYWKITKKAWDWVDSDGKYFESENDIEACLPVIDKLMYFGCCESIALFIDSFAETAWECTNAYEYLNDLFPGQNLEVPSQVRRLFEQKSLIFSSDFSDEIGENDDDDEIGENDDNNDDDKQNRQ